MVSSYEWKSDLSKIIQQYISVKKITGLKFEQQERHLRHFDSYYYYNGYKGIHLTKPMLEAFIYNRDERPVTHYNKEVVMNHFAGYLNEHSHPTYIPDIKTVLPRCSHIPHIYTKEELQKFFRAVDEYPETKYSYRNSVDPVLFRFLYGTGVRLSEALGLRLSDISLADGIATIRQAKNNKDRLIPMAEGLVNRMAQYIRTFHRYSQMEDYVFPGAKRGKMDKSTAYNHFRDYLLMADIPHTQSGPRIHDFRHGLAVTCLKKWSLANLPLSNMLPYLAAYMGHSDFRATQYYLRLTADLYPDIISRTEAEFGYVIPEGDFEYEEG